MGVQLSNTVYRWQAERLTVNSTMKQNRLALSRGVSHWSLTTLREKLIKIGAEVVCSARYVTFQMAEVAIPKQFFAAILQRIGRLRSAPSVPG